MNYNETCHKINSIKILHRFRILCLSLSVTEIINGRSQQSKLFCIGVILHIIAQELHYWVYGTRLYYTA